MGFAVLWNEWKLWPPASDLRTENAVKYGDLPEFMDFEYLRKIAASNLAN
jgi:hypothetical protein